MSKIRASTHLKHPDIGALLDLILSRMRGILGEKLVGLYIFGSLAAGDFDYEISDIDLLAAAAADIGEKEFSQLEEMHDDVVKINEQWEDRLEIAYVSLHALKTFKTQKSRIAIISPGEPFHTIEAGKDWLLNWLSVRENGVTLFGPPPATIIEAVSKEEFIGAVREKAMEWREYVKDAEHSRPYQGYVILTMCRAFYAVKNGEQVSKRRAAQWAQGQLPEWASLIQNALSWRESYRDKNVNHEATFPETQKFAHYVIGLIAAE